MRWESARKMRRPERVEGVGGGTGRDGRYSTKGRREAVGLHAAARRGGGGVEGSTSEGLWQAAATFGWRGRVVVSDG